MPGLELGDDATRIFLNTRGRNPENVSEELVQLLHYLEYTNDSNLKISDERVKRLQQNVRSIQQNAEIGVKYMQLWEEKILDRMEERAVVIIDILEDLGEVSDSLKQTILKQNNLDVLKKWTKNAVKAGTIEEFVAQM